MASAQSGGSSLLVKLVDGLSPALQADVIARNGGVERSVIPSLRLHVIDVPASDLATVRANYQADPRVVSVEENRTRVWETVPADPLYGYQWALPRIAWDQVFGNMTPTGTARVALLDTGVDALHPDLAGKVVPGTSILDGSNGMTDPSGHGTWLAGIIAAQTDNAPVEGIAGVAYAGVTVLPVTVLNANGEGQDSDVIAGVVWAADHGVDVILMAFSNPGFSPNLQDAIDYAWSKGIVLVAAVGNGAVSDATFPAGDRGVMGVAATDANDTLAYFSNDGQAVFIAAPGVDISTTDIGDAYVTVSGTSTSAAIVAGAAALMKAVDPTLTNGIVVGRLARNADPAGTQSQTGNGRINLARALADTSVEFVQPAGAAPVGAGGPFVGPYVAAAINTATALTSSLNPSSSGASVTFTATVTCAATGGVCGAVGQAVSVGTVRFGESGNANCGGSFILLQAGVAPNAAGQVTFTTSALSLGAHTIRACYSGTGGGSGTQDSNAALTQTVNPLPTTTSISPISKAVGDAAFLLTVNGTGNTFQVGAIVQFGGSNRAPTTRVNANQLTVTIPASDLTTAGTFNITVLNPDGGVSNPQTFTVSPKTITASITASNKPYDGTTTASVTCSLSGVLSGQTVTCSAAAANFNNANVGSGKTVTATGITLGGTHAANYQLSSTTATTTADITPRGVTVTANAKTKTYGNADPALTYLITSGSLAAGDSFTGTLTRDPGENVGTYAITQGTLALSSNYALTFVGATLTIQQRAVTVTADTKMKTYGAADPALTYQITSGSLAFSDTFSGALTRVAGEAVGSYAIQQGTLTLGNNYDLIFVGANLTIQQRAVTVTADAMMKTYGAADPPLTYQITSGSLVSGDSFSGVLTRDPGEDVGSYAIKQGALALSSNYALAFVGNTLSITKHLITVTADPKTKPYGNADPALTYQVTSGSLAFGDGFAGALTRDPGEAVGGYAIRQGTLALSSNYALTFIGNTLTITARQVTVTADPKAKVYGDADPALTHQVTSGSLVFSDAFSGALTRVAGEAVGSYPIQQGTLALSANYALTFVGSSLTINARAVTVTADPQTKVYGAGDPPLTYEITSGSLVNGDGFTGSLARAAGETVGTYAITQGTLALSVNYQLAFIGANLEITQASTTTAIAPGATPGTFTATVSPMAPASTTPTGSVQFKLDGMDLGAPVALSGGQATSIAVSTSGTPGQHTIGVFYLGDLNYQGSSASLTDIATTVMDDAYAVLQGGTLTVGAPGVLANDADADTAQALAVVVTQGLAGLTVEADGSFTYTATTPAVHTFKYSVFDGVLYSPAATVTITVLANTATPVALNDAYSMTTGGVLTATKAEGVLANDQGTTLRAALVTGPAHGTLTAPTGLGDDGAFDYTPAPGFAGVDTFFYTATDGSGTSNVAMVTITVLAADAAPVAVDDYYLTTTGDVIGNVLGNDAGSPSTAAVVTGPLYGTLSFQADGSFTYTAGTYFAGVDSFTYRASDATVSSNLASVTIRQPAITVDAPAVTYGDDGTVRVTVSFTGQGPATGSVTLSVDGGAAQGPIALDQAGKAVFTVTQPTAHTTPGHGLFATYANAAYQGTATATGALTVHKATPTITWPDPEAVTYGTALSGTQLDATATFKNNPVPGTFAYNPASGTLLNAGNGQPLHVDFTPDDAANFNGASKDVHINVLKKAASVTPDAKSKTYGDADPALTGTLTGFLDNVTATYSRTAGETVASSPYTISATLSPAAVLGNYDITYNTASFTINKRAATWTTKPANKTYGYADPNPLTTGSGTNFLASDDVTATYSRAMGETVPGGPYHITAALSTSVAGALDNYDITNTGAEFTINPAPSTTVVSCPLSVTHNGVAQTPCTASVTGAGLSLAPTPTYANNVNAGTATASYTYPGDANHTGSSDSRNFAINQAPVTATAGSGSGPYNGLTQSASACAVTGVYTGLLTCVNSPASAGPDAGTTTIMPVVSGADIANFSITLVNGLYTINQATPTVKVTGGSFIDNAQPHPATGFAYGVGGVTDVLAPNVTFSYAGIAPTVYAPSPNAPSTPGAYFVTAAFAGNQNYTSAHNTATITITNAPPQAQGMTTATNEDVPLPITLRARDLDNSSLSFIVTSGPVKGSLSAITPTCTPNGFTALSTSCSATVTYSPNANYNGSDSFTFKVNDGEFDSNEATVSITVYPMNDAPAANAQSLTVDNASPGQLITLMGTDVETPAASLTFEIVQAPQHGTLQGTAPNVTYVPDIHYKGPDSFTFTVTDRGDPDDCGAPSQSCADKQTGPPATVSITVTDGTPPMTLITALKPASLSNDRNPTFGFSGTDNVTDPAGLGFECKLDNGPFSFCGTPGTSTTSYTSLGDGSHTFQVRAKDESGNVDPNPRSYTWTIDATPPDTLIDSRPTPNTNSLVNTSIAIFTFHSTENSSTLTCALDGGTPVDCTDGTKTYMNLRDGQHTFMVAATDPAGNVDPTPAAYTWTIDTTAPQTAIDSGPSNPAANTTASFTFHGSDPTGQDTFECSLDSGSWTSCSSPKTFVGLALGQHTFQVRATDRAGNTDATSAGYAWTVGQVVLENYAVDTDFKKLDGFDVGFGGGNKAMLRINSTNPDSFHYQVKLTNNTGVPVGPSNGNQATAIITVPGMPASCGGVPCSTLIGSLGDPAFVVKGKKVMHVYPGHDRDDDDDDDMPVTVAYLTQAQYVANSNTCDDNGNYSSMLPSGGAPKCIKITGFNIPVKHGARIRINFQFRLKGVDGWSQNAKTLFYAGFVFQAKTSVSFGSTVQTGYDATGLVGAGNRASSIGGYAFSGSTALTGYNVRLFAKASDASCSLNTKVVAQDTIDGNGFYYIWRSGTDQHASTAPSLPSGVQYAVQLCNGSTQVGLQTIDGKLGDKEFEEIDFNVSY